MIEVELPDGRTVSVDTDDPQAAAAAAKAFIAKPQINQPDNWQPPEREPVGQPRSVDGMSNYDKFALGATKSVVDIGRGLKQMGLEAGNAVGLVDDSSTETYRQYIDAINRQDAPLMESGAGLAGNVAGTLATTLLPVGIAGAAARGAGLARTGAALGAFVNPASLAASAGAGAVQGAIQPVGTEQSRIENAGIGAATGAASNALLKAGGRIAQPVKNQLGKVEQWAVGVLAKAGVPLDLAQKSGSGMATRAAAYLDDSPATVTAQQEFRQLQQAAYNRAVLRTIGENADAATPDVMGAASSRIGQVFDDVAANNPIKYDNLLNKKLQAVKRGAQKELSEGDFGVIDRQMRDIVEKATQGRGLIDGKAYQNIKSSLDRVSGGQNQGIGHWARETREVLDDAMERSLPDAEKAALKAARRDWRRLKQIESAMANNESGDIIPTRLYNSLSVKANRAQTVRGKGDQELVNIARAGKVILKSKTPNSGTTARITAQLAPGAVMGGLTMAAGGDYQDALQVGAATYAAPKAVQYLMNNPGASSTLAKGLPPSVLRQLLESPQTSSLVGGVLRHAPAATALRIPQQ